MARKTHLKLFFWKIVPMSQQGRRQWTKKLRPYLKRFVYKPELRVDVPVTEINTKQKIIDLVERLLGSGVWIMRGITITPKTKTGFKWVRLAVITVRDRKQGYHSTITEYWRLSRYWFWQKR